MANLPILSLTSMQNFVGVTQIDNQGRVVGAVCIFALVPPFTSDPAK